MANDEPVPVLEEEQLANPPELRTVFLGGIFFIMLLTSMRLAGDILIPIVLAFVLKLVFLPVQNFFESLRLPRFMAALAVIVMLCGLLVSFGVTLSTPATEWATTLSRSLPTVQKKLHFLSEPIQSAQELIIHAESIGENARNKVMPVAVQGTRLHDRVFTMTREVVLGLFTTLLLLFFLLASGDTFLRRLVEVLPRFSDKRQAVDISQKIQEDLSIYLLTITFMNAMVGIVTGIAMYFCGLENPILWGAVAFFLNYIPIVGPLVAAVLFALVGLMLKDALLAAMIPSAVYLFIHLVESTLLTPILLAKRFTLNPVLIIFSLVFWYWMWGLPGAILAVPLLAIVKIICDRVERLKPLGHFLGA